MTCAWCRRDWTPTRRDAVTCGPSCRQARHRFLTEIRRGEHAAESLRLAFADPPYVGLSGYYVGHPDYNGEVDHAALVRRLFAYDGWALACSVESLPYILSLTGPRRVASWVRGARTSRARGPVSSWEAVIYQPARSVVANQVADSLVYHAHPRRTDPGRVMGSKPAPYWSWIFGLLTARSGDTFDDIFPGSGRGTDAWAQFAA